MWDIPCTGDHMPEYKIDGYALRLWSSKPTTHLSCSSAVAGIYMYQGETYRGYIHFYPDGTPLASPYYDKEKGCIYLHFNLSQFDATMDTLRTEDNVHVYYRSSEKAALRSGKDPTGKEE
jgi:hypothetical protein